MKILQELIILIKRTIGILTTLVYLAIGFYPFNWIFDAETLGDLRPVFQVLLAGFSAGNMFDYMINLFGFIPYGLVIFYLNSGRSWMFATSLCLGLSLTIETGQLLVFTDRVPSLVDLALNTLGGMFGAWLGESYLSRHYHRFRVK